MGPDPGNDTEQALTRSFTVVLALIWPMVLMGAGDVHFQRISLDEGLTQSSIGAMAQCSDGYMWFGTQYGLNRYDGYTFKPYRHDPEDPDSLSNSAISQLKCHDPGRLWVATRDGLNLFDTHTGKARHFYWPQAHELRDGRSRIRIEGRDDDGVLYLVTDGIAGRLTGEDGEVEIIPFERTLDHRERIPSTSLVDDDGRFWLLNPAGLWRLDTARMELVKVRTFEFVVRDGREVVLLDQTTQGQLALATRAGLMLIDPDAPEQSRAIRPSQHGHADDGIEGLVSSEDGSVWMVLDTVLVRYQPDDDHWQEVLDVGERLAVQRGTMQLQLVEDQQGNYWLNAFNGVGRWLSESERVQWFHHQPQDHRSIPPTLHSRGYKLLVDEFGTVWIGSQLGGLAYFSPHAQRFEHVRDASAPDAIPYAGHNIVRGIAEQLLDDREYLWSSIDAAGLRLQRRRPDGRYDWVKSFHAEGARHARLPDDRVWDVAIDPVDDALVWALERRHLVGIDARTKRVVATVPIDLVAGGGRAKTMRFSSDGSVLWLGTSKGLKKFHFGQDRTRPQACSQGPRLVDQRIYNLLETPEGSVLVAGRHGLGLVSFHGEPMELFFDHQRLGVGAGTEFYGLAEHSDKGFWVGTSASGLGHLRLDGHANGQPSIQWFGSDQGLVDETIYAILVEDDGRVWLSSNRGLMRFDAQSGSVRHFTPPDGVQHFEFNNAVATVGQSGRFYFGGINGINVFRPESIERLSQPPRIKPQEVLVNGRPVALDPDGETELVLPHDRNDLEVTFVGLHFADPSRIRYAFMLDGLDSEWSPPGTQRRVRYAGLSPGDYQFLARAANSDDVWSERQQLFSASIRPPPWKTTWAYLAYGLATFLIVALAYGAHHKRRRVLEAEVRDRTHEIEQQQALLREQAVELRDALEARGRFFANISHEFRTPLTLIQSSIEDLEAKGAEPEAIERARRYSKLLLDLVDELLDLSRLRAMKGSAMDEPWALSSVVTFTVDAFRHTARKRGLELRADVEQGWWTYCSREHVEKILLNLLANAVKFTSSGDFIEVRLGADGSDAVVEVIDSGPGIPAEEQEAVFVQLHRSADAVRDGIDGNGLGLALVREMVQAMGGTVVLESKPGRGSRFRVVLPALHDPSRRSEEAALRRHPEIVVDPRHISSQEGEVESMGDDSKSAAGETVLVVEDNRDLLDYLGHSLGREWRVLAAADGQQGLDLANQHHPDLVVSDIMMPKLDGFELLKALRSNPETSHIPVLLLTARQDRESRLQGLALSADDFMAKPFDVEELGVRIRSMLANRERLRHHLLNESTFQEMEEAEGQPDLVRRDRELIDLINRTLADRLSDPAFDVAALSNSVAVERRTLQRKLKALTGMTPAAYIRHFRLKSACRLLVETDRSITEVAAACGFSSPQSFSRVFKKRFHDSPEQWRHHNQG